RTCASIRKSSSPPGKPPSKSRNSTSAPCPKPAGKPGPDAPKEAVHVKQTTKQGQTGRPFGDAVRHGDGPLLHRGVADLSGPAAGDETGAGQRRRHVRAALYGGAAGPHPRPAQGAVRLSGVGADGRLSVP